MPFPLGALELDPHARILLMGEVKTGKTTHAISTSPGPVRVLLAESDDALRGAKDEINRLGSTTDVSVERVLADHKGRIFDRFLSVLLEAKNDAKNNKIKSVVIDPLNLIVDHILEESFYDTRTHKGEEDGRSGHPLLTRRVMRAVEFMLTIPAHVIVVSHSMEVGNDDDPDKPKMGIGIVPLMPNMKLRKGIAALFYDILWFETAQRIDQHYENRVFVTGREGAWGLGCRLRKGNYILPAHIGQFIAWENEPQIVAGPKRPAAVKPAPKLPAKAVGQ